MISYKDALGLIQQAGTRNRRPAEWTTLSESLGRILETDLDSPEDVPSFDNSAMDGYAVYSQDLLTASTENPIRLPVGGQLAAGDLPALKSCSQIGRGYAVEIMTGAPMPQNGMDAVVRIEDVKVGGDGRETTHGSWKGEESDASGTGTAATGSAAGSGWVEFSQPQKAGANVRTVGSDYQKGQPLAYGGTRIGPEQILALASLGVCRFKVRHRPKIGILSTGAELVAADSDSELAYGMIRNSTAPYLVAALEQLGFEAHFLGRVGDDPKKYRRMIEEAIGAGTELILSTGAVSMGKVDFVAATLEDLGAQVHFHKAAIRPGKPILFAEFPGNRPESRCAFFGLPGNPVSTAVGFRFFVEPYLRQILGLGVEKPALGALRTPLKKPKGLKSFLKGHATRDRMGGLEVEALSGQASFVVSSLTEANCWIVVGEEFSEVTVGQQVEVVPIAPAQSPGGF